MSPQEEPSLLMKVCTSKKIRLNASGSSVNTQLQTEPSMEPLWAWQGKTLKNTNTHTHTKNNEQEQEQDKYQYKNNKLQCKYKAGSGGRLRRPWPTQHFHNYSQFD